MIVGNVGGCQGGSEARRDFEASQVERELGIARYMLNTLRSTLPQVSDTSVRCLSQPQSSRFLSGPPAAQNYHLQTPQYSNRPIVYLWGSRSWFEAKITAQCSLRHVLMPALLSLSLLDSRRQSIYQGKLGRFYEGDATVHSSSRSSRCVSTTRRSKRSHERAKDA